MAAPLSASMQNMSGPWVFNKSQSDSTDALLRLQGVPWWKRQAAGVVTVTDHITHNDTRIDTILTITGGFKGGEEFLILDGSSQTLAHENLGPIVTQATYSDLSDVSDDWLKQGWYYGEGHDEQSDEQKKKEHIKVEISSEKIGASDTVKTPIWFSQNPLDSLERSKMSAINGTAFEQWYFETVSEAGDAFLIAFGRDPSYKAFGHGVLPIEMTFLFRNGTRVPLTAFAHQSHVTDCCGEVRGEWTLADDKGTISWRVSADVKSAEVKFDTPMVQGLASWKSRTPARYADGSLWPSKSASTEVAPHMHFTEPIPIADAQVSLTVHGSPLEFKGMGGHFHDWVAFNWFNVLDGWEMLRATAGPYAFTLLNPTSRVHRGVNYQSAILFKDGEPIFTAFEPTPTKNTSQAQDYVQVGRQHGGTVRGGLADDSSGWTIDFIGADPEQRWSFSTKHKAIAHEQGLGQGTGLTVFTDEVSGGEVGGEQHTGYGICEQVVLPASIDISTAWSIFKIHRDNNRLSTTIALWKMLKAGFAEAGRHIAWKLLG
ncbi:hypothetical protein BDV95DRAFT_616096 [Massariosphaeria phaeospora]|uniref:Uncharacterized protein n=1 Tax=Massariosphaeria phaeospora TaxID=100035 RepID=A0A7C8MEC6_9PLEO|nr:hypothetical protein BDV95DRAFT_616096 [Massariosphaeria phaeospora]